MKMTRRNFLKGALALSLIPAIGWPARQVVEAARYDLVSKASRATFSPLVGSTFQIFTVPRLSNMCSMCMSIACLIDFGTAVALPYPATNRTVTAFTISRVDGHDLP